MSHLWAFHRRPSCLVRYRHGGSTALYPWQLRDSMPALLYEAHAVAMAADQAALAEDNVLEFPARDFSGRDKAGRPHRAGQHSRPSGPKKHRD
jgi:hypothetical protein